MTDQPTMLDLAYEQACKERDELAQRCARQAVRIAQCQELHLSDRAARGTKRVPREFRESGRWTGITDRVPRLWPRCTCSYEWKPLGRLYGIGMGVGWVRLDTDTDCPRHGSGQR